MSIEIDGEIYHGSAVASDPKTLAVKSLTQDFLEEFMNGMRMEADFGGARWTVSLIGSNRATVAMGNCMAAARRSVTS